jgi:nicotinamidase-related amidase
MILHGQRPMKRGKIVPDELQLDPSETVVIGVDLWDRHWCKGANERALPIIEKANRFMQRARETAIQIIHAPSETMAYYAHMPQRKAMEEEPMTPPPENINKWAPHQFWKWGLFPLWAGLDGGCFCQPKCQISYVWKKQHERIEIHPQDLISDNGHEIFSYLKNHKKRNIIYLGVHVNMCVLGRPFGIRAMKNLGFRCVLVRDLTDSMYNPSAWPYVTHEQGTERVIAHIEKWFCPTILSADFILGETP